MGNFIKHFLKFKGRWIFGALLFAMSPAQGFEFGVLGGLDYSSPTQTVSGNNIHWTSNGGFSYGFVTALSLFGGFDLESGVFFLYEPAQQTGTNPLISASTHVTEVPLLLLYNIDEHIAIGGGGYYGFTQDPTQNNDSGLLFDIRARMAILAPVYFVLDGRYQYGLANRTMVSTDIYNTRSLQVFGGLLVSF